jgi:hypothetical protein
MLRSFDRGPVSVLLPPPLPPPPLSESDCCARLGNDDDRKDDSAPPLLLLSQYSTFDGRRAWWTMMHAEPTVSPIVAGEGRNLRGDDEKENIRDAIFFSSGGGVISFRFVKIN